MGYSIQYGSSGTYGKANNRTERKLRGFWPVILATVTIPSLLLILLGNPGAAEGNDQAPLPWQRESVQEAFLEFSDSVRDGEEFGEAVECLYRRMLTDAESK